MRNGRRLRRAFGAGQAGFTLLELIIVIAVIGILATIALPRLLHTPEKAKEAVLKTNLRAIRDVLDQYYADRGHYPPSLDTMVEQGYLRAVPVDPITRSSQTWVLVFDEPSLEEAPAETDMPEGSEPGVIDVRSGAPGAGTDGTPYSEW